MTATVVGGALLVLALVVGLVMVLGSRARVALAARYPPPGRLVDLGGYRLHILCQGAAVAGQPTVVLESGNAEPCLTWASVQPVVAKFARVCSYDRAGLGWSDPSPVPRTAAGIVAELHTLLQRAGIQPPYIMVGHSIGGMYARLYAHEYPEQVAGMVMVDAAHEGQDLRFPASLQKKSQQSRRMMALALRLLEGLSSSGLLALLAARGRLSWPTPIPPSAASRLCWRPGGRPQVSGGSQRGELVG